MCDPTAILLTLDAHMRAAAIFGLGCSPKNLKPFQAAEKIGVARRRDARRCRSAPVVLLSVADGQFTGFKSTREAWPACAGRSAGRVMILLGLLDYQRGD